MLIVGNGLINQSRQERIDCVFELLNSENDRDPQGEESIISTVSEEWTTMDTTSVTSVITGTVSSEVATTTEWLELTTSIFMERKYTSFYTYVRY